MKGSPTAHSPSSKSAGRYAVLVAIAAAANIALVHFARSRGWCSPGVAALCAGGTVAVFTYVGALGWVWRVVHTRQRATAFFGSTVVNVAAGSLSMTGADLLGFRGAMLDLTPTCVYGVLTVLRYLWLDRSFFGRPSPPHEIPKPTGL